MDLSLDNLVVSSEDKSQALYWEGKPPVLICINTGGFNMSFPVNRFNAYKKSGLIFQVLDELPDIDMIEFPSFVQLPYITPDSINLLRYIQIFIDTLEGVEIKKPFNSISCDSAGDNEVVFGNKQNADFIAEIATNPEHVRDLITISNYFLIPTLCSMLMFKLGRMIAIPKESFEDYHTRLLKKLGLV
jgi:hypothetical protein